MIQLGSLRQGVAMSASEQTAIRSNAEYIAKMGEAIGEVYGKLWQEMAWIHTKWAQYIELFGTNPERIDLLNRAASAMIRTVQDTLWDDVLLHLARLNERKRGLKALWQSAAEPSRIT